ncbi:MAG: sugar kinase [Microscillaceae bacterium]|nr:sugar kinase [Microscillaceae bacterium]
MENKLYDLIAVGELLVDLIGQQVCEDLSQADEFHRFQGGSPSNLASNLAKLGKKTAMVASVGRDNFGKFLIKNIQESGVDVQYISENEEIPTSLVINTRTLGTPDFIAYREADRFIFKESLGDELLANTRIFHTTCFGLSRNPAQETIMDAATRATKLGCTLSIDMNYAPQIWPARHEALDLIKQYCRLSPLIKISQDDYERLLGEKKYTRQEILNYFIQEGAQLVCLTLGGEGSLVQVPNQPTLHIPTQRVDLLGDATGAGDAYWAGFLSAWLDKLSVEKCAEIGSRLAALKLQQIGPLTLIDKKILYQ